MFEKRKIKEAKIEVNNLREEFEKFRRLSRITDPDELEYEKKRLDAWGTIPDIDIFTYPNIEEITDDTCPHCGEHVGFVGESDWPDDIIGRVVINRYHVIFYKKCPNCGKIFTEEVGEETEYRDW